MKSVGARIAQFNRQYADKGGYPKYLQMRKEGYTNIDIADQFGVHPVSVSLWNKEFDDKESENEHVTITG
jgi:hypothetical protein